MLILNIVFDYLRMICFQFIKAYSAHNVTDNKPTNGNCDEHCCCDFESFLALSFNRHVVITINTWLQKCQYLPPII